MLNRRAGFFRRMLAFLMDWVIIDLLYLGFRLVGAGAVWVGLKIKGLQIPSLDLAEVLGGIYFLMWLVIVFCYFTVFFRYGGQTPAKRMLALRVISIDSAELSWSQAGVRTLGYLLSAVILLGIGFLIALVHPQKRTAHDLLAGTVVIQD